MSHNEIEIIENRKDILHLAGFDLYRSELTEKLPLYKGIDKVSRKNWTIHDLDTYLRKSISTKIIENEFQTGPKIKNKKPKIKTDKEMITIISQEYNIELMAIKHLYNEIKNTLQLDNSKDEDRNMLIAQIQAHLDDIDLRIENSVTEKDQQKWYEIKMKAIDQFAKIRNLEDKTSNNITMVHGDVNSQQTVDKQIVLSEQQAMLNLVNKLLPNKGEQV